MEQEEEVKEAKQEERWVDLGSDLIEAYRNLIAIKVVEHTSRGASVGAVGILSMILAIFILLFTGIGLAWWIGETLNDIKVGFFIIGGVYAVVFITLLLASRKVIVPRVRDLIIKKIYDQD